MTSTPAPAARRPAPRESDPPHVDALAHPLHTGLTPQVRADGTLQLGVDPVHGVVLAGLSADESAPVGRLLTLLTGASDPLPTSTLASLTGLTRHRVLEIIRALDDAGLTRRDRATPVGAEMSPWVLARRKLGGERSVLLGTALPVHERRAGARVVIDGRGPLAGDLARLLRAAHVGEVHGGWYAGAVDELDARHPDPGLVITLGARLPRRRAADWLRRSIAHLPVVARTGSVVVGPLVVPGAGPCLTCIRLHEGAPLPSDLGGEDPLLDAQNDEVRVEPSLAAIVAGTVAMLALGHVDAYPPPTGIRWHTALPLPSLATSRWEVHPGCDAGAHRHTLTAGVA